MNEAATEPKSKRRWYQYSLRSLVVVMILFCFLFAWIGVKIRKAEKQKAAVTWVEKMRGNVYYDYEFDANGAPILDAQPPGPDWLREWIGIDYFCNVESLYFEGTLGLGLSPEFPDIVQGPLQALPFLRRILFGCSPLIDKELLRKIQKVLPNCVINRRTTLDYDVELIWCQQCNNWHFGGSDPHSAPD